MIQVQFTVGSLKIFIHHNVCNGSVATHSPLQLVPSIKGPGPLTSFGYQKEYMRLGLLPPCYITNQLCGSRTLKFYCLTNSMVVESERSSLTDQLCGNRTQKFTLTNEPALS